MLEGQIRIPSGCAISGVISTKGRRFNGSSIRASIASMHDRSNGLGGGFVAYGIYPEYRDLYALHLMYEEGAARNALESYLHEEFTVYRSEPLPTKENKAIKNPPILWRYFVLPNKHNNNQNKTEEADDYVSRFVMMVNGKIPGAYVFSSGKNMGVFKGVGYPEDIADYFQLEEYEGYLWVAHGRFPTNTPGWWGGAHPLGILDWSVVHNGEVSSYGINKRYLEMFGYCLELQTDTEVIAYLFDLLHRCQHIPLELVCRVLTAPFWEEIDQMPPAEQQLYTALRRAYGSAMLNGPFSVIVASKGTMIGLNDRIKLRPLVGGCKEDLVMLASEESALHAMTEKPEQIWQIRAGERFIAQVDKEVVL